MNQIHKSISVTSNKKLQNNPSHKISVYLILLLLIVAFTSFNFSSSESPYEITRAMFAKTKLIRTMTYSMKKKERIGGKIKVQQSITKLNRNPFMVYVKQEYPKKGVEVLYVNGRNQNKALVNPNGFPWINLNLDPNGSTMRNEQHHTILDSGYDLFVSIMEHLFDKYNASTRSMLKLDTTTFDGNKCWVVTMYNNHFNYYKYKVQEGETLIKIGDQKKVSEYMVLEKNKEVDNYDDVLPGQYIDVPNDYSPQMILYIDQKRYIPLVMKIYDDKGFFEQYEYYNVKLNPQIKAEEFTSGFTDYGF